MTPHTTVPGSGSGADTTRRDRVGYWAYVGHLLALGGIALSNAILAVMLVLAPWVARDRTRRVPWRAARPMLGLLGLYALLLMIAIALSPQPRLSAPALSEVFNLTVWPLALRFVRGQAQTRRVVDWLTIAATGFALFGLIQLAGEYGGLANRIRGPFSHWMTFSGILLMCDLLLIARMVAGGGGRSLWRWGALIVINAALLASLTRSAWVALLLALLVLAMIRARRLLLVFLPAAVLFVALAPTPLLHRIGSIVDPSDPSNYDRLCMADAGLRMVAESPVVGIGPEMVERRYGIYRHPTAPRFWVPHLHNSPLQLAAERGIPTMLVYLALMVLAMSAGWRLARGYRGRSGESDEAGDPDPTAEGREQVDVRPIEQQGAQDLGLGVFLALLAFNVAGLFENNWGDTEVQRLALFIMAIPWCLRSATKRAASE